MDDSQGASVLHQTLLTIALYPSGGVIHPGTPEADRDTMIHAARTALCTYHEVPVWGRLVKMLETKS